MIDLCGSCYKQDASIGRAGNGVTLHSTIGRAAQGPIGSGIGRGVNRFSTLNESGQSLAIRGRGDRHPISDRRGRGRPVLGIG